MTKGTAALSCTVDAREPLDKKEEFWCACLTTSIYESVTLPFVIPSAAEGSAVRPGSRTNVYGFVSSHTDSSGLGSRLATGSPGIA
jgi:hypothetical protein